MNTQALNIAFEESVDKELIVILKESFSKIDGEIDFHEMPNKGPQASLLYYGLTAISAAFGAGFFTKLGHRTAEDSYPLIKDAFLNVYRNYFGGNPKYQETIVATSAKKVPTEDYSLSFSLYCTGKNNEQVKFLYKKSWTESQFNEATEMYLAAMCSFVSTNENQIRQLIASKPRCEPLNLVAWDSEKKEIINVCVSGI